MTLTVDDAVTATRAGNAGALTLGQYLHQQISAGHNMSLISDQFELRGASLPEDSTCSKYRQAWESWIHNAKLQIGKPYTHETYTRDDGTFIPFTIEGVSAYKLYHARDLIDREDPVKTLAWLYRATLGDVKDAAANAGRSAEARVLSLPKVQEGDMEIINTSFEAARGVDGGLSKGSWLVLMSLFFADMRERTPDAWRNLILSYSGAESP